MRNLVAIVLLALAPGFAAAHALGVECKLKDGKIAIEAFYDDDTPAAKAKVEIVDAKGKVVAGDVTDGDGRCTILAPRAGQYEVRVDAGAGHRAKKTMVIPGAITTAPETTVTDGTRADFVGTPWLKITIGLGTIGGLCGAFVIATMLRRSRNTDAEVRV